MGRVTHRKGHKAKVRAFKKKLQQEREHKLWGEVKNLNS